mmetsp:Transcript_12/g.43  ORF Transcript_12/g.43 Transcript_12/m.43 type:complete len:576 (-) Transcript_12:220-1947(-)
MSMFALPASSRGMRPDSRASSKTSLQRSPSKVSLELRKASSRRLENDSSDDDVGADEVTGEETAIAWRVQAPKGVVEPQAQNPPDNMHFDGWLEIEVRACMARIDASMGTLPSLDKKLDEILSLLGSGDTGGTVNTVSDFARQTSPKSDHSRGTPPALSAQAIVSQGANLLSSPRSAAEDTGGSCFFSCEGVQVDAAQKDKDEPKILAPSMKDKLNKQASYGASTKQAIEDNFARRNSNQTRILLANFFEDSESSSFASMYARSMLPLILVTVCFSLLEGVESQYLAEIPASLINAIIESLFLVEVLIRLCVTRSKRLFFLDVYNLIDIMSGAPLALRLAMDFEVYTSTGVCSPLCALMLGLVPVLRLLKLLRRFQNFHLLLRAFSLAVEALPVLLFIWGVLCLVSGAALFVVEPRDNIPNLAIALWCGAVSMTTLGYGDVYPVTTSGMFVIVVTVTTSILYTAIPLGIIGNAFSEVWCDRDRILLMQKTRKRLLQAGYHATDIPHLFKIFDLDNDGALDIDDFRTMVGFMKVGLADQRVVDLFDHFDADGGGSIDDKEFVRTLFPKAFAEIYGQ